VAGADRDLPLRVIVDGGFAQDLERSVDWVVHGNAPLRRVSDESAQAVVYLSTEGSPPTMSDCVVRLRAVDRDGKVVAEGQKSHACDQHKSYSAGTKAAAFWAIQETVQALQRKGTPPSAAQAPRGRSERTPPEMEPVAGAIKRPKAIAVVVGIETYRRDLPPASGARADAELFATHLEGGMGIPRSNIHVLVDADGTKSSIDAELDQWLPRNATESGEVFFFFAGHGGPDPQSGERYLVPWDADPRFIATQGIPIARVAKRLANLPASHTFAFVDACFSGAGGRSVLPAGTRPLVLQQAPLKLSSSTRGAPQRLTLFSAAAANEITGAVGGHGLFSASLFRALHGAADRNADGDITLGEVIDFVTTEVPNEARRDNRDQHPEAAGATAGTRNAVLVRVGR
jgi:hypothetical protein